MSRDHDAEQLAQRLEVRSGLKDSHSWRAVFSFSPVSSYQWYDSCMDELWDVKTAASHLGLSTRTVYQFARDGRIPGIRVGGRWRFRRPDLDRWIESKARARAGQMSGTPAAPSAPDAAGLADFLSGLPGPLEKRFAFMGLLTRACVSRGWQPPVIVGGQAVEFYSAGGYATVDIDLVSASEPLDDILPGWGFERRGRHWIRADLGLIVEAPGSRLAPGQRDRLTEVEVAGTFAYVLGLEDVIVDRLAACVHWSSQNDCRWAKVLVGAHKADLDLDYLRTQADAAEVSALLEQVLEETT
jgi:excisionase family DNA binding protein